MKKNKYQFFLSYLIGSCLVFSSITVCSHSLSLSDNSGGGVSSELTNDEKGVSGLSNKLALQEKELIEMKKSLESLKNRVVSNDALISYLSEEVMQIQAGHKISRAEYPDSVNEVHVDSKANKSNVKLSQGLMLKKAYDLMNQNKYSQAIDAFNAFLKNNPDSKDSDDVYYFLGELYVFEKKSSLAIHSFQKVGKSSSRAADALVALGQLYLQNGDAYNAKKTLDKVIKQYPNTDSSQRARLLLSNM